jgi:hypothetical protein
VSGGASTAPTTKARGQPNWGIKKYTAIAIIIIIKTTCPTEINNIGYRKRVQKISITYILSFFDIQILLILVHHVLDNHF